ncbi:MAG TPA: 4a-hydroxytetrahydrobiopterin dehydratase, partial [Terriglobales bacterium]
TKPTLWAKSASGSSESALQAARTSRFDPATELRNKLLAAPREESEMSTVLSASEIDQALEKLPGWRRQGKAIERVFQFDNFLEAMEFVNKIAGAAEAANHHPDIAISYNKVTLALVSHDSGGVTQRDIRMAGKINDVRAS